MAVSRKVRFVYQFEEVEEASPALLGGKGAHLCEMAKLGLPVPPGFVITTEAFRRYQANGRELTAELWQEVQQNLRTLEEKIGRRFGDPAQPLVVSVRSGAPVSMPGMMDTILNLGLTDANVGGLAALMGEERPALDAYRRFLQGFGHVVLGVPKETFDRVLEEQRARAGVRFDHELGPQALRRIIQEFQRLTGGRVPQDPWEQLRMAVGAVFGSWFNPRAVAYREHYRISADMGTACVVMAMVFGNLGPDSGTGVLFTRDPATGERRLYGEYLPNAQGEDVVAGVRTPMHLEQLRQELPQVYRELEEVAARLERFYRDAQDVEFTVERGRLYMLQTRSAKRTATAAVRMAVEMVEEGLISREDALRRVDPDDMPALLLPRFAPDALEEASRNGAQLAQGIGASPGAATGRIVLDAEKAVEAAARGERVVLVRPETSPDDIHGIIQARGVLTSRGGITSHAAVVTRGMGKPCVVGCEELRVDLESRTVTARGRVLKEGDEVSIDGATGMVYAGAIATVEPTIGQVEELRTLLGWADAVRRLQVWANADTPEDAARARELGAQGIGLCRTEHMFFDPERLPFFQQVILTAAEAQRLTSRVAEAEAQLREAPPEGRARLEQEVAARRAEAEASPDVRRFREALARLEEFQESDFYGILKAMRGLPVIIRLLDALMHEALPPEREVREELERRRAHGQDTTEQQRLLELLERTREANPMMGHRGCRMGITFPEVYEMQVRAILRAAARLTREGVEVHPEIMVPLAGHVNELRRLRALVDRVRLQVEEEYGVRVPSLYGTMIEVPRAALTADELAQEAEFFSVGSNDLTQMAFGYSRDDAEGKFLRTYLELEVLPADPFRTLDVRGVGELIRIAVERGRRTRPGMSIGICGEHGGDPASVRFCHEAGLDYVSASPLRVPVARLAAAQAALDTAGGT